MSNTVRQRRKRPRVRSCSFKTLGWLIRREASWCIYVTTFHVGTFSASRVVWSRQPTRWVVARAERLIRTDPGRRYYP